MVRYFFSLVLFLTTLTCLSQNSADHWETIVYDSTTWNYFVGLSDPGAAWKNEDFDDAAWAKAIGGFGYGDDDDRTTTENTPSLFLRKKFKVTDINTITSVILDVDYDDGFVAYLNGIEIARANINDPAPSYDFFTVVDHEAVLYRNLPPERFSLSEEHQDLLKNGENVLAIEVHNANTTSSDLTIRPFLSFGMMNEGLTYFETPEWFVEPLNFQSSNLPILIIETNGQVIVDEPEIIAHLGIVDNGPASVNSVTDPFNGYDGNIEVEYRGESSQMFPKKSLKITTVDETSQDVNVNLLGMPSEHSWILYAPYSDKTMLRNALSYMLGNKLGHYATRTRYCEVVINGEYMGVYILMEKIKRDKNRVDIAKLTPDEISGDDLTGGYILRVDKLDPNDFPGWQSIPTPQLPNENPVTFQFFDPDGEDLAPEQKQYIKKYITDFQSSLTSANFKDPVSGYKKYIDINSFVDFMLINELNKNIDAYVYSTYMYKDKDSNGGKLTMGPIWDFNLAFGNVDYLPNAQFAPGWMYNDSYRMFWFRRMMQDAAFKNLFTCRWLELRETIFDVNHINNWIDSTAHVLQDARERNFQRWPVIGTYVWPNQYIGLTYDAEVDFLKDWIEKRINWMDNNLSKTCSEPVVTSVEGDETFDINVFPNPSSGEFVFSVERIYPFARLDIFNAQGTLIHTSSFETNRYHWSGLGLAPGVYLYTITTKENTRSGKIIKTR